MTVSTPYFNSIVYQLDTIPDKIAASQKRLTKSERKLARLQGRNNPDKHQQRIERQEQLIAKHTDKIDRLTGQLAIAQTVDLPKDKFVPSFWVDEITGENWGISMTITDSPYDDTYIGGTPVSMQIAGRYCKTGQSGFSSTRGQYFGEKYLLIDSTETIGFSSDRLNGDYSITVRLLDSDTRVPFYEQQLIDSDGVQLI